MDFPTAAARVLKMASLVSDGVAEMVANQEVEARIDRLPTNLGPYGVDPFGFDPQYLKKAASVAAWFYRYYFRCATKGVENVPDGRIVVVGNHSGQLPFDAAMISIAILLDREQPRYVRSMLERFVPDTPFVSTFMARCGQILGTPENCRRVLVNDQGILVFPEGVRGLNKTFKHAYRLQDFGQGFMRLAIETNTPIVPTVVIGAEEQAPALINAKALGKVFGMPAFPVTPTNPLLPIVGLMPYPVRYRIYFGEPMVFAGNANDEDEVILAKVEEVRSTMQQMIDDGLAEREHVFW